jgi:hypothetical protein
MLKISLCAFTLTFAALSHGAEPVLDNERVVVWDTTNALPPSRYDFVSVSLSQKGTAAYGHRGAMASRPHARTVVIELKDDAPATIPNNTPYPLAFPRPYAKKLLENDRVIVWDYVWHPGKSTPMHYHDKDALVVFESNGAVQSTTPDGQTTVARFKSGDIRFNGRDRAHRELLVSGHAHAVIVELK